ISPSSDSSSPASYPVASASTTPVATNTWTHLVGTFDATTGAMSIYVNGALAGSGTNTSPWSGTGPLTIGGLKQANGTTSNFFTGSVANVQVYNRTLSASEASTLNGLG